MKDIENKTMREVILVIVVLLVVIGDLAYYKYKDPQNVDTEMIDLITVNSSDIDKIILTDNTDEDIIVRRTLEEQENGLVLTETQMKVKETSTKDIDLKRVRTPTPNKDVLTFLEYSITNLQALKTVQENAEDIVQFGLDKPICEVSVKLKNGVEKSFVVGNKTVTRDSAYYMKMTDSNTVYTLSVWDLNNFLLKVDNL